MPKGIGGISHAIVDAREVSNAECEVVIPEKKGGAEEGDGWFLPQD